MTRPAIAPTVSAALAARGAELIDLPVLQPADPFLDMAGEDLRRRIFLTESETGESLCLRPEFTIPVCLSHIATQAGTPRRYAYLGEVFRQRRDGANEFFQAGIEDLGDRDIAAADARSLADAHALLAAALPGRPFQITLGDQAVFEAVLAALGLPRGWQKRLIRAFGAPGQLASALEDIADPARRGGLSEPLARMIAESDEGRVVAFIAREMEAAGLPAGEGRTPHEIARRLAEKAELANLRMPPEALLALRMFLAIHVPLERAVDALAAFGKGAGIALDAALDIFADRAAAIAGHELSQAVRYDAAFGRPLDYYTGMVFEIAAPGAPGPLAGGGRYDRLLTLLGAASPIPGVGFSVWLDRLEAFAEQG